jgi:hypothetical protein
MANMAITVSVNAWPANRISALGLQGRLAWVRRLVLPEVAPAGLQRGGTCRVLQAMHEALGKIDRWLS